MGSAASWARGAAAERRRGSQLAGGVEGAAALDRLHERVRRLGRQREPGIGVRVPARAYPRRRPRLAEGGFALPTSRRRRSGRLIPDSGARLAPLRRRARGRPTAEGRVRDARRRGNVDRRLGRDLGERVARRGLGGYGYPQGISFVAAGRGILWESRGLLFLTRNGARSWISAEVVEPEIDFGRS